MYYSLVNSPKILFHLEIRKSACLSPCCRFSNLEAAAPLSGRQPLPPPVDALAESPEASQFLKQGQALASVETYT